MRRRASLDSLAVSHCNEAAARRGGSAATPGPQRLRQMRHYAGEFTSDQTRRDGITRDNRLLTQPIYRYRGTESPLIDGAVFVFAQGTNPEVYLLLEAYRSMGSLSGNMAWAVCRAWNSASTDEAPRSGKHQSSPGKRSGTGGSPTRPFTSHTRRSPPVIPDSPAAVPKVGGKRGEVLFWAIVDNRSNLLAPRSDRFPPSVQGKG